MNHINSASNNNQLTYDDIKRASRILAYDGYEEIYNVISNLNGISRIFESKYYLESSKISMSRKRTIKQVLKDLENV